jgi:ribose 5-phosphate isomerase B
MNYTIAIASDHAGFELKHKLVAQLQQSGITVVDLGPDNSDRVDYPDYAAKLAAQVASGEAPKGILICGSGVGMSMAANRHKGIRCVLANDVTTARLSRLHNNSNVLALGARLTGVDLAWDIFHTWYHTPYEGGRHDVRISKIDTDY